MGTSGKTEKRVRFGCGFVFGLLLGGLSAATKFYDDGNTIIAVALVVAVLVGLAAAHLGESFWRTVKHWVWWFP